MGVGMKLRIQNFQSIEDAELTFDKGLIAITGPNSSGKSAIFRALRSVILNPTTAKHSVKRGTKRAQITVSGLPDTPVVSWARTAVESSYQTAEGEFQRAGRNNVFDFIPAFPLRVDGARLLNFQTEWDTLFPFEKSNTELYTLFEHIFSVVDSATIVGLMKQDEKTAKAKLTAYTDEMNAIVQRQQLRKDIFSEDAREETVIQMMKDLETAEFKANELTATTSSADAMSAVLSMSVGSIDCLPKEADIDAIQRAIKIYNDAEVSTQLDSLLAFHFEGVTVDWNTIQQSLDLDRDMQILERLSRIQDMTLTSINTPHEMDGSLDKISWALELCADAIDLTSLATILRSTSLLDYDSSKTASEIKSIEEVLPIITQCDNALNLDAKLKQIDAEIKQVKEELAEVEAEINNVDRCPLCGNLIGDHKHE